MGEAQRPGGAGELFAASGPVRAMAMEVLAEWRLAQAPGMFRSWLKEGAPSEDAEKSEVESAHAVETPDGQLVPRESRTGASVQAGRD